MPAIWISHCTTNGIDGKAMPTDHALETLTMLMCSDGNFKSRKSIPKQAGAEQIGFMGHTASNIFGLLVYLLPGPNKQLEAKPSSIAVN
jgi:hypothetical protein